MPHIEKRDDKYIAVVEVGTRGKRKRRYKTFRRKRDAENWIASMTVSMNDGKYVSKNNLNVADHMDYWLENEKKPHLATTTYDSYKNRINAYIKPEIGYITLQELETYHLMQFFNYLRMHGSIRNKGGLSESTIKKVYVQLNAALDWAVKAKILNHNPMKAVESPKPKDTEMPVMTSGEVKLLLDTVEGDMFMHTFLNFAVMTGLRKSEMLGLEWQDINDNIVSVRKRLVVSMHTKEKYKHENETKRSASKRDVVMPGKLVDLLKKWKLYQNKIKLKHKFRPEKNFVFAKANGEPYYPSTISHKAKKAILNAGLSDKYSLHTLRHTFATISLNKNKIPVKIVQQMLGHAKSSTTLDTYTHADLDMQKDAAQKISEAFG